MFTCRDISERATDYREDQMSAWERFNWKLHLLMCRDCRQFVKQFFLMVRSLQRPLPEPSETEVETQLQQLKQERS